MAEGLQYKIGADVTDLQKGIDVAVSSITKLEKASTGVSKSMQTIKAGATAAAPSLNALGQVARDLPFGFIAIQNNLPILFDQFTSLSSKSGGVAAALKGIGSALLGPAGLAFAFGAIISGITVLTQKYGSIGAAISALLGTQTALSRTVDAGKKSYDEYTKSIVTNQEIIDQARGSSQGEIEKVNALVSVIDSETSSREKKNNALIQLQKINKDYFGDLTIEDSKTGKLTDKVNEYTQALIKAAVVKGFEGKISELSQELFKQEDILNKVAASYSKVGNAGANALKAGATFGAAYQQAVAPALAAGKIESQFIQQVNNVTKLREEYKRLTDGINKAVDAQSDFAPLSTPKAKKPKDTEVFRLFDPIEFFGIDRAKTFEEIKKVLIDGIAYAQEAAKNSRGKLGTKITITPKGEAKEGIDNITNLKKQAEETVEVFNNFLAPAVDAVFGSIANGSNVFDALKQSLRAMVAQFAVAIVKAAVLAAILASINPVGAAAGGLGKGIGGIFKSLLSSFAGLPKFAEGGIVSRPTLGMFGEAGPEAIMPLDKLNSMLGNFGGGGNMQVSGSFALRGNDLYASIERTKKQQGRAF